MEKCRVGDVSSTNKATISQGLQGSPPATNSKQDTSTYKQYDDNTANIGVPGNSTEAETSGDMVLITLINDLYRPYTNFIKVNTRLSLCARQTTPPARQKHGASRSYVRTRFDNRYHEGVLNIVALHLLKVVNGDKPLRTPKAIYAAAARVNSRRESAMLTGKYTCFESSKLRFNVFFPVYAEAISTEIKIPDAEPETALAKLSTEMAEWVLKDDEDTG